MRGDGDAERHVFSARADWGLRIGTVIIMSLESSCSPSYFGQRHGLSCRRGARALTMWPRQRIAPHSLDSVRAGSAWRPLRCALRTAAGHFARRLLRRLLWMPCGALVCSGASPSRCLTSSQTRHRACHAPVHRFLPSLRGQLFAHCHSVRGGDSYMGRLGAVVRAATGRAAVIAFVSALGARGALAGDRCSPLGRFHEQSLLPPPTVDELYGATLPRARARVRACEW